MVKLTSSRTDSDPYWWLMPAATSSKAIRSRGRGHCGVPLLEQKTDIAGQDLLARRTERADVRDEIAHRLAGADFLGIVGGEHDARGRNLHQRRLHRADGAAEAGGVEHEIAGEIVVEILLRLRAVARMPGGAPEILVLVAADAAQHGGDAAAEVRHVNREARMAIEHAGIDQPDGRHDQREFAADRARGVVYQRSQTLTHHVRSRAGHPRLKMRVKSETCMVGQQAAGRSRTASFGISPLDYS